MAKMIASVVEIKGPDDPKGDTITWLASYLDPPMASKALRTLGELLPIPPRMLFLKRIKPAKPAPQQQKPPEPGQPKPRKRLIVLLGDAATVDAMDPAARSEAFERFGLVPFPVEVPSREPVTEEQFAAAKKLWLCSFHKHANAVRAEEEKPTVSDAAKFLAEAETEAQRGALLRPAAEKGAAAATCGTDAGAAGACAAVVGAVVVDPGTNTVVARASDGAPGHVLHHTVMRAVAEIATLRRLQQEGNSSSSSSSSSSGSSSSIGCDGILVGGGEARGGARGEGKASSEGTPLAAAAAAAAAAPAGGGGGPPPAPPAMRMHTGRLITPGSAYLCTGLDLYITREPCTMCAMALVHSRIRHVIYRDANDVAGALGSCYAVHALPSINHHYRVFRLLGNTAAASDSAGAAAAAAGAMT